MAVDIIGAVGGLVSGILKPVSNAYSKRQDRKMAKDAAKAKIVMARESNGYDLKLSDKEWEALGKASEDSTWKDEYVTMIFTMPILGIILGSLYQTFTGDPTLLQGVNLGISNLKGLGLDYGEITYIIVLAAVGLKVLPKL